MGIPTDYPEDTRPVSIVLDTKKPKVPIDIFLDVTMVAAVRMPSVYAALWIEFHQS